MVCLFETLHVDHTFVSYKQAFMVEWLSLDQENKQAFMVEGLSLDQKNQDSHHKDKI